MSEHPLQESSPTRALKDSIQFFHHIWGFILVELLAMGGGVVVLSLFIPIDASQFISAIYQFAGAIIGFVVGLLLIFIMYLTLAPYRQQLHIDNEMKHDIFHRIWRPDYLN